jgi:type I restriction enzyme S subunit
MRYWICRKPTWLAIAESSTGMGSRRQRVQPEQLLRHQLPLPPLPEQRRIVARIECLAAKIAEAAALAASVEAECAATLSSLFRKLSEDAPRRPLGELAPLTRRPAKVDPTATYPQVSVRSFGRGSFHSGVLEGASITWEKPHLVLAGDILVSNIKAWEGAIAVAMPDDDGRYGSHRYLTFQPDKKLAAAEWLCHFLVSSEGLFYVGEASPGSADRNRTTSARAMCEIEIPVPSIETQSVFVTATKKIAALKQLQSQSAAELEALLPSILDRAFKGEL